MIKKIFTFLAILLLSGKAYANISIYPYSIDFEAKSRKRIQSVRIINTSGETQTYRVSIVNFLQDKNGKLTETKENKDYFASPYLKYSPRQFTLQPDQVQTIHVARQSMANAKDGEYVSHLKIREISMGKPEAKEEKDSKHFSVSLKALFAVTIPITLNKGIEQISQAEYISHKLLSPKSLEITLKRKGDITSRLNIYILNKRGKQIGLVRNLKIYKSTSQLTFSVPINTSNPGDELIIKAEDAKQEKEIFKQVIQL